MTTKQKRNKGDIVQIDLGHGRYGYAQLLDPPLVALFDVASGVPLATNEIVSSPVAFCVWVMESAITGGDWRVVGNARIPDQIDQSPPFFKKDRISGTFSITYTGAEEEPATFQQIKSMECAAVWNPEHVVDRLNDHFDSRPNKWVSLLKPVQPEA